MKGLRWIAGGAASVAAVVILLISGFQAAMYADFGVYEREYTKYQVLRELDMEMEDAMYVTREMMAYLKGDRERLSVVTTVEGTEQDFFNEQDRLHMDDVQGRPCPAKRGVRCPCGRPCIFGGSMQEGDVEDFGPKLSGSAGDPGGFDPVSGNCHGEEFQCGVYEIPRDLF